MQFPILSLLTKPVSSASTLTPIFQTSLICFAFVIWSVQSGIAIVGTPKHIASNVEFQPQCVRKHPTASCVNTSS
ncbi:hypothetical protein Ahy_A05g021768 [Arachis hypogaea]|uniref:Uncharacterized protein n=1 Tax=Arachis hypogaea TaxID=3818 RepID=A0A445CYD3_ARAHY|nr:hypothetical protein Ahy_A05g021768 [Arachis hypogaea]